MSIDLHTHSTVSDGTESPAVVAEQAARAGLEAFALTDHDSTSGWAEAAARSAEVGVDFVPGMEVSCATDRGISVHLLSYLHDPEAPGLSEEIERSRTARRSRARRMVEKLSEDFPITWEDVRAQTAEGATVGRPHIADALVAAGVCGERSEAFGRILTTSSRYYVPHYAPHPAVAVSLVRQAGGVPVFAHPMASSRGRVVDRGVMEEMVEAGLAGLEVFHRDNAPADRDMLLSFARERGLLVTGSSDYHGAGKPNRLGENTTASETLAAIRDQARA
ncbi:PHP domain-containing protein [Curtobacterium sp. S6]|uniref:PHP domain-containing protein n=1 Tax=Curtobacterium sp. S6 TaxID=1479623 RepID=UPI0004AB6938|nr:PHP domain-containing protein [Curtobacterium sp. S6]